MQHLGNQHGDAVSQRSLVEPHHRRTTRLLPPRDERSVKFGEGKLDAVHDFLGVIVLGVHGQRRQRSLNLRRAEMLLENQLHVMMMSFLSSLMLLSFLLFSTLLLLMFLFLLLV